ncbi:EscU/YscU/HrcU family type III secretion system export apparatus switch protein [Cellulomonas cellasea]|uniref:EscU/YscU/HrcU family type III secretion system export apparatus switch protein n=1 Tax=Cellulomonas cellasea TaxID=43670 RepID=UPI0025A34AD7|nr:EscU/YscU/HrcU family type III secretion system export apparatus switch protein [Cellulomonas cellasea]MDM8083373.1 EscU/YscU/HrcU family type III secretion system export apparatus switch protein [Cellulomonas cellasea]
MSNDGQERSEKATPQRMKEVRRKGELARSQDLSAWIGLGAAALMLPMVIGAAGEAAKSQLAAVRDIAANPREGAVTAALEQGLGSFLPTLAPMFALVVLITVAVAAAQGGVHFKKLKLNVKQLNVLAGIKRLFSGQTWWQGAKTLLKTGVVAGALYFGVQSMVPMLMGSGRLTLAQLIDSASSGATMLLRLGIVAGILLAVADVAVVMRRNRKKTRMTMREVKDEHKRSEGDPLLKGAIRSKQMAMSRNRMMAAVADADVVLVNPTHVAVALSYKPGSGAPRVVAKGAGVVATRIREEATAKHVPLVEDIPLARALHGACELGEEVPEYLFTAVARVLAFVMTLRRRGAAAGKHRVPGVAPELPDAPERRGRRRREAAA